MDSRIAVIILNYNTFEDTVNCIDSIVRIGNACHIIVVDNNSPDGSGKLLKKYYHEKKNIDVLLAEKNRGFSCGNNIGMRKAIKIGAEYVFLLNSDIILKNDAISVLTETFRKNPDVGVVGPAVYNRRGDYAQCANRGLTLTDWIMEKKFIQSFFVSERYGEYDHQKEYKSHRMVNGCCFGMSKKFIEEIGYLDEGTFMYYEEDILAYLLKKTGYFSVIAPQAEVIHLEGVSTEKVNNDKLLFTRFYRWTSQLYVLRKYAGVNIVVAVIIALVNIIAWSILAVGNLAYGKKNPQFIMENIRALKGESAYEHE